ncbi:hypothetical protein STEG23_019793, partial [Scotinomys teguina]
WRLRVVTTHSDGTEGSQDEHAGVGGSKRYLNHTGVLEPPEGKCDQDCTNQKDYGRHCQPQAPTAPI